MENLHDWYLDEYGKIDIWRFEGDGGFCNGPECRRCHRIACHHCNLKLYEESCLEEG